MPDTYDGSQAQSIISEIDQQNADTDSKQGGNKKNSGGNGTIVDGVKTLKNDIKKPSPPPAQTPPASAPPPASTAGVLTLPPVMHKGGTVPKTGPYTLQKGEEVVPKSKASEYRQIFLKRRKEGKHSY